MSDLQVISIIPARGGSKGIPGKNLSPVASKPLIAHTLEHAREARKLSRIIVSTDSREIGAVSRGYGAEVVWRPAEISGDTVSSESALLHVLERLKEIEGYEPQLVVFLQCTSPIRWPGDIDNAIEELIRDDADSLLSVVPWNRFLWCRENGRVRSVNYDHRARRRRQDRHPEYLENGSIYIFKPWVLRQFNNRLGGKIALYVMNYWSAFEIDNSEDLELCDWILRHQAQRRGGDLAQ